MTPTTSKARVAAAMSGANAHGMIPVMCQLANGHTIINTGVHPIDYWVDDEVWADSLSKIRALYDFDGILVHKPGRTPNVMDMVVSADYDADTPTLYFEDGARVECPRDDDAYYKPSDGFAFPSLNDLDPDDLMRWAPDSYVAFQHSKGTWAVVDPDGFDESVFATFDAVLRGAGDLYSVHAEVRSPFDHFLSLTGIEPGLMATIEDPERTGQILDVTSQWSVALAIAQCRRGADAIKISSPFAGGPFLSRRMYQDFVLPWESRIAQAVRAEGVPAYTHTCGAIGDRLDLIEATGVSGIECLDPPPLGNVEIERAREQLGDRLFIKGNVDPVNTLLRGSDVLIGKDVGRILTAVGDGSGFILSSACSVAPLTPPNNIRLMVELARSHTSW